MAHITKKSILKRTQIIDKKRIKAEQARQEELDENICVIGYASKLFRDDAKALSLHRGKHLIPWQGDSSLMIDRYDVRGHLQDLSDFETDSWNREYKLSSEEQRIEALCDEERYLALHKDLIEEQHRQEEELKRLNEAIASDEGYNAVSFQYEGNDEYDPMNPTEDETEVTRGENTPPPPPPETEAERAATPEPDEEPFIAPDELNVPKGIERPATLKTHLIIEKTAMFVSNQGPQMEIIVKAKQANNPQFSFLNFEHYLNPYYKHLVKMIKSKRYRPKPLAQMDQNNGRAARRKRSRSNSGSSHHSDDEDENESSGYLHPSLLGRSSMHSTASTENRIPAGEHEASIAAMDSFDTASSAYTSTPTTTADYHIDPRLQALMAYMDPASLAAAGYFDPNTGMVNPYLLSHLPPPPPPPDNPDSSVPAPPYMPYLDPSFMAAPPPPPPPSPPHPPHSTTVPLTATMPPHTTVPPPIVTVPPPIMTVPPPTSLPPDTSIPPPPVLDPSSSMGMSGTILPGAIASGPSPPTVASEPEISSTVEASNIIPPPPDIQPIIDKLAKYVAKNGEDFEVSVRSKADQRFEFLLPWHPFNAYYMQKKRLYLKEMGKDVGDLDASVEALSNVTKGPVSFSIKSKKVEERELDKKSALPIESSSSESEMEEERERTNRPLMRPIKRTGFMNLPARGDFSSDFKDRKGFVPIDRIPDDWRELYPDEDVPPADYGQSPFPVSLPDDKPRKPAIPSEELAFRNSKHRLQDRLAVAARDKLASESKERILQMERRKKAALFLNMIKDRPQAADAADVSLATDLDKSPPAEVIDLVDDEEPISPHNAGNLRKRYSRSSSPPSQRKRHGSPPQRAFKSMRNRHTDNDGKSRRRARSKSPSRSSNRKRRHMSRTPSPKRSRSSSLGPENTQEKSKSESPSVENRGSYLDMDSPDSTSRLESPPAAEIDLTACGDARDDSMPSSAEPAPTDLRSKVRAMLAETRGMVFDPT